MRFRNPAGYAGLGENLKAVLSSGTRFLGSRLSLASKEAKGALLRLVTLVACLVIALIALLLGYLFLLTFVIVGIAHLLGISWIWVALVVALLHFMAALVCLVIARGQLKHPMFRDTREVLQEDTEWLKNLDQDEAKRK